MRVLFLVGGDPVHGLSPASRFRVYAYQDRFAADDRFDVLMRPSIPPVAFHERPWFKRHRLLAKLLIPFGLGLMVSVRLSDVVRAAFVDVVVIQKPLLPGKLYPFLEMLITRVNPNVLFDFDDAKFVYHRDHSSERSNRLYRLLEDEGNVARIIARAAHVTPGNAFLADYARRYNDGVTIVPTPVDVDYYKPASDDATRTTDGKIVIGWIGTSGNLHYLEELASTLRQLQQTYDCELRIVCNPTLNRLKLSGVDYRFVDWSIAAEIEQLAAFDIGIMPLLDTQWERGKCGFKLLQYMAQGIPVVGSPVGVNAQIIEDGRNGFLAGSPQQWQEKLARLIREPELRASLAREGRRTVVAKYSIDETFPLLAEAIIAASQKRGGVHR